MKANTALIRSNMKRKVKSATKKKPKRRKRKITNNMNDIITQLQALATSDQAAVSAIVTALQALPMTAPAAVTLVSVVATFSDGSTQRLPVLVTNPVQSA